ncbi:MAG: hypothetical protein RL071_1513, partial [Pseudomonadota bacterium]
MQLDTPTPAAQTRPVPAEDGFAPLGLIPTLLQNVAAEGYTQPTPIQTATIPLLLARRDVVGCAQTGTGKTAAFALPVLQLMHSRPNEPKAPRKIRALVLSPTRELAAQIGASFQVYGKGLNLRHDVIFGGVGQGRQVDALRNGLDILVATTGRLLDLHQQGYVDLKQVEFFVLDEADRMLDMGFIHDIRRILPLLPKQRQSLLFSATMPPAIAELARSFLVDPAKVEVTPPATTVERIDQDVMFVEKSDKPKLLAHVLRNVPIEQVIVFSRTKHGANRLVKSLEQAGIESAAIHGNKSQNAREAALGAFRAGKLKVLVATDVASRGLDVDGVSHVINYDLPNEPESYVHRIGRTGRAGRSGKAISFCDREEIAYLLDIERLTGVELITDDEHPWHCEAAVPPPPGSPGRPSASQRPQHKPQGRPGGRPGGGGGGRPGGGARPGGGG